MDRVTPCRMSLSSRLAGILDSSLRSTVSISASTRANSSRCSAPPGAARRRRWVWWRGAAKTATLRMVAGLEQNTGGRISIGNEIVSDATRGIFVPSERRKLGMVFQSYAIWPHMTVFDNVAYPLRVRRRPAAEILDRVTKALQLVEMEGFAERPTPPPSWGEKR